MRRREKSQTRSIDLTIEILRAIRESNPFRTSSKESLNQDRPKGSSTSSSQDSSGKRRAKGSEPSPPVSAQKDHRDHRDDERRQEKTWVERLEGQWSANTLAYHLLILIEGGYVARREESVFPMLSLGVRRDKVAQQKKEAPQGHGNDQIQTHKGDGQTKGRLPRSGLIITWSGHELLEELLSGNTSHF
jgi:hypothetical protein